MNLKELAKELNYLNEIVEKPKYIGGDLNNTTIEYKGKCIL